MTRATPPSREICRCSDLARANRVAARMGAEFTANGSQPDRVVETNGHVVTVLRKDDRVIKWVCHNGGLLNEWAKEWNPRGRLTLTAYLESRLRSTLDAKDQSNG